MTALLTVAGALVVGLALRDVFHTLWHPTGQGAVASRLMSGVWRLSRRLGRAAVADVAGPVGMVLVVTTWAALVVTGFTLVVLPHMDDGISYGVGLDPQRSSDLLDALYLSLVSVSTLGYGDLVPTHGWLRAVIPLQALVGFGLLSAAVTWVLQVYPALGRRRALAVRLSLLGARDAERVISRSGAGALCLLLDGLAAAVAQVRVDLSQYPESYYFHDLDTATSLPEALPVAWRLADAARESADEGLRLTGQVLTAALEDLAEALDRQFLHDNGSPRQVLQAYAADHAHPS